jgi:predicted RNase H-like nuclease
VCFWALGGFRPLAKGKLKPEGHAQRIAILRRYINDVGTIERSILQAYPRGVGKDDILDAICGAVTGLSSVLSTFPSAPEKDAKGRPMEVVYRANMPAARLDIRSIRPAEAMNPISMS